MIAFFGTMRKERISEADIERMATNPARALDLPKEDCAMLPAWTF
jgi:hypothetical protein